jgi:phenylacetate-CoA ligase
MKHFLDIARGAYAHLPAQARSNIAWALRFIPEDIKWGSTYRDWRELLTQTRRNPALIRDRQDRARLTTVTAAAARSPYYRTLFDDVFGPRVELRQLLDDANWRQIPILTPATVMDHARDMCTRPPSELDIGSSGGTSGKPVKFYLDRHRSPIEYAFVHDAWARAGFRAGDPRCVFRSLDLGGSEQTCMQYDPALAELRCSVFHLSDETMGRYHEEIVARGIRFIHGYPSAIAIFSAFLLRAGLAPLSQIKAVFPSSERFNAEHKELVSRAFGQPKIVPFYGLSEKVAFASVPGDDLDVFEFEPLYGYTELLDDEDTPVTTVGTAGRIVSTGLLFPGMPFFRYDTGDRAELVQLPEAANGYRLAARGISPKHGIEYLLTRSNLLIAIKGVISNLQGTAYGIREYQFYQDTPGKVIVRIAPLPGASNDFTKYRDLLNRKMKDELQVAIEIVDAIATTQRGKRKLVDQRLDLSDAVGKLAVD